MIPLTQIISGGQTGADLAALDAAISAAFPYGGWIPNDRKNEDGPIPAIYTALKPVAKGGYATRMIKNVCDSDGTLIFYHDTLEGGTAHTVSSCMKQGKPFKLLDMDTLTVEVAAEKVLQFVQREKISLLNVAGPRASKAPQIYKAVYQVISEVLKRTEIATA